jgi:hypothetical protein
MGSTRAALLAGIQHANAPVATYKRVVLTNVGGSQGLTPGDNSA